jgi:hypothetical protein
MEPLTTLAAGAIVKLAFDEFVKSSAGEAAKKLTGEALAKANELRKAIWAKFKGNDKAEKALIAVEQEGSEAALDKLEVYLDDAMTDDVQFAEAVGQLTRQIQSLSASRQTMASGIKADGDLSAKDMTQTATSGTVREQEMLTNVEAKNINLGNLTQAN